MIEQLARYERAVAVIVSTMLLAVLGGAWIAPPLLGGHADCVQRNVSRAQNDLPLFDCSGR